MHLEGNDLIRHNLVVFNNGEGALKTLPALVDTIPEARLNLVRTNITRKQQDGGRAWPGFTGWGWESCVVGLR